MTLSTTLTGIRCSYIRDRTAKVPQCGLCPLVRYILLFSTFQSNKLIIIICKCFLGKVSKVLLLPEVSTIPSFSGISSYSCTPSTGPEHSSALPIIPIKYGWNPKRLKIHIFNLSHEGLIILESMANRQKESVLGRCVHIDEDVFQMLGTQV